ncbi:type III pantothenate kinase [Spirosomataceae bacterium TFI 002]|nr:type III pantothenate kinase [Spirosomataceae bacterium TFI 002]
MLIADIGNTDSVFGVIEKGVLTHTHRLRSNSPEGAVFYEYELRKFFLEKGFGPQTLQKAVFSSVVPQMNQTISDVMSNITSSQAIQVKPGIYSKVKVDITKQDELGSDIYCNSVATYNHFGKKCIVVDFGTALTFTGISDNGTILGVAIAPGIGTALKSLFSNTAQLPEVPLEFPEKAMGTDTVMSIQSGILYGYEGMVKNILQKFRMELGEDAKIAATGGLSGILHTLEGVFDLVDVNLTLEGLKIIGEDTQE